MTNPIQDRCPHCGSILYIDYDGYEDYLACFGCAREFDFNITPRRMAPDELYNRFGIKTTEIKLTPVRGYARIRVENG